MTPSVTTQKFPTPRWHPPEKYEYVAHVAGWDIYKLRDYMQDIEYHGIDLSGRSPVLLDRNGDIDFALRMPTFTEAQLDALREAQTFAKAHHNLSST